MPSLVEQYSHPEDIAAHNAMTRFWADQARPAPVRLWEHGPEQDDRWCLKHYREEKWWIRLILSSRPCRECTEEERQAWVEEVRCKFQRALQAAAEGRKVEW